MIGLGPKGRLSAVGIAVAALLLLVIVVVAYREVNNRMRSVDDIGRMAIWAALQIDLETVKLHDEFPDDEGDALTEERLKRISHRYDILYSRVDELLHGTFSDLFKRAPELGQLADKVRGEIIGMAPEYDALSTGPVTPGQIQRLRTKIEDLRADADDMLSLANGIFAKMRVAERQDFVQAHIVFSISLGTLTTVLALVIVLLIVQLKQIRQDQKRLVKLNANYQEAAAASEAGNQAKSAFLAAMSHEMRTPLNGILGTVDLLAVSALDRDQRDRLTTIIECSQALLGTINNVLDFSKLESGSIDLEVRPFELAGAVEGSLQIVRSQAQEKGLSLTWDCPDITVSGDETRFRQILVNFLSNAVKFTRAGAVSVKAFAEGDGWIKLEVLDTGIGIPEEGRERLFREFSQFDPSIKRRFGGTGLGLAIAHRLAEAMGGEIGFESVEGRGSTFWCRLPLPATRAPASAPRKAAEQRSPTNYHAKVLIVEDNLLNMRVARELSQLLGAEVSCAYDGQEGLEMLRSGEFDIVLMDVQMPVMDGLEATRALRAEGFKVPVVGVTANAFVSDRDACMAAGMDDFMPKPVNREKLEETFARWLKPSCWSCGLQDQCFSADNESIDDIDEKQQAGLLRDLGKEAMEELVSGFWTDAGKLFEEASDAQGRSDDAAARKALHSLKGVASTFGFSGISKAALAAQLDYDEGRKPDLSALRSVLCERGGRKAKAKEYA